MDITSTIQLVISTLNDVEVKGKDNLDKLLGCILTLECIVSQPKEKDTSNEEMKGEKHAAD